jgi:hypothetical protein
MLSRPDLSTFCMVANAFFHASAHYPRFKVLPCCLVGSSDNFRSLRSLQRALDPSSVTIHQFTYTLYSFFIKANDFYDDDLYPCVYLKFFPCNDVRSDDSSDDLSDVKRTVLNYSLDSNP